MYVTLIKTYLNSINKGCVPNIENAWLSVCREESLKAFMEALEIFDKNSKEQILNKIPLNNDDIRGIF